VISEHDVAAAIGSTAYGSDGHSVGTVEAFYSDDRTGATTWVSVSSGLLGTRRALAPAHDATFVDGRLQLGVPSDAVSGAPRLGGEHLAPADEEVLRQHYATGTATRTVTDTGTDGTTDDSPATDPNFAVDDDERVSSNEGAATSPTSSAAPPSDGGMVRNEEQLRVRTEQVAGRRVRVVRYVVTEEVQVTVPIRREEIRIEELPADAPDDRAGVDAGGESLSGGAPGGAERGAAGAGLPDEIVLHAERPVVTVEVVPVERVRLRTELITDQERVSGTVQREQVAVDQDTRPGVSPR
jgi:stress response protein YsnF